MRFPRPVTTAALGLMLGLALVGCGQQSASTASPSAAPTQSAPASSAPAASPSQSPAASAKPAASPSTAASPSSAGASVADLISKAKNAGEYSFAYKMTGAAVSATGKTYVKGAKTRQEMNAAGQQVIMLVDTSTKTAYTLMAGQKTALKMDFSQAASQIQRPADRAGSLPVDAKPVGTETVDGKQAAVFEITTGQDAGKMWIWTERGVPLKFEASSPQGKVTMEFTDYQFGPQPDNLFELPADYKVIEMPTGIPGKPGASGLPSGIPSNIPIPNR